MSFARVVGWCVLAVVANAFENALYAQEGPASLLGSACAFGVVCFCVASAAREPGDE